MGIFKKMLIVFVFALVAIFTIGQTTVSAVETNFHGQFRINSYAQDGDDELGSGFDVLGSRLRYRPTWDLAWDSGIKLHMQLNIGHINSNIYQSGPVLLRHGYVLTPLPTQGDWSLVGGLVPLSDKFGDTLFSSDWDFNPLTYMVLGKLGEMDVRFGHGNASEGDATKDDDVDLWFLDIDGASGFGASLYSFANRTPVAGDKDIQNYLGVRYAKTIFSDVAFDTFAVFNSGTRQDLGGSDRDNDGFAVKGQVKIPSGSSTIGLMALYASGDQDYGAGLDSDAFITPMSLYGGTGYWGYTGKLNEQGPTDTRIDDSTVNIDGGGLPWSSYANLGLGMLTVQANIGFPINENLDAYGAVGYFLSADKPDGGDDDIGFDVYAQGKYKFGDGLNLEFGIDYVSLGDGHYNTPGDGQSIFLVFSRFQLEF